MTIRRFCYDVLAPALAVTLLFFALVFGVSLGHRLILETQARTAMYPEITKTLDSQLTATRLMFKPLADNMIALSSDTYDDQVAAIKTANADTMAVYNLIFDLRANLFGGEGSDKKAKIGIAPETLALLDDARSFVADLRTTNQALATSIVTLTGESAAALRALTGALARVDAATAEVEKQVAANGRASAAAIESLESAIKSADKLISDPDIAATLSHVEGSAESLDDLMRPWRKAGNKVLAVLKFLAGRFTYGL